MAKKKNGLDGIGSGNNGSVYDLIKSFDNFAEILSESKTAVIKEYIDTGNYMLNACMTGSLFRGLPSSRITTFAGPSGCGKSFISVSICRNAQKVGYTPIYLDSESAIDIDFVKRLGCDPSNFIIRPVNKVSEVSTFITRLCENLMSKPEDERQKIIIVLDSLGNLTSDKEHSDIIEGNNKRDMTLQREVKAMFRNIASPMGILGIPMICTSHVYQTMDLFSKTVVSGGTGVQFAGSLTIMLTNAKLEDKSSDAAVAGKVGDFTKTGVVVTATPQKSRFTIPQKVQFQIPFFKAPNPYVGLEKYLTWENSGVIRGEILTKKEYEKLPDTDKGKCYEMADENGEVCYARPKDTARTIVVKHLGTKIPVAELWTSKVFTDELLHKLDENVIRPSFELPSSDSFADVEELIDIDEE